MILGHISDAYRAISENINYTLEKRIVVKMPFSCLSQVSVIKNHVCDKKSEKNHISRRIIDGEMILGHNIVGP